MPAEVAAPRRRAAVLGHPVAHSLSPVLHLAAYSELGLDWEYGRHDVDADELAGFVVGLGPEWVGLSLTMPLKEAIRPLLDDVDPVAEATGSVNTVVMDAAGLHGWNTDVEGIAVSLDEQGAGTRSVAVLGSGATARSAVAAAVARGTTEIIVVSRRVEAAAAVVATAQGLGAGAGAAVLPWDRAAEALGADAVISTVPRGAADALTGAVPSTPGCLLDVVYDPWPTPLARAWAAAGGTVASGLDMLLHQAVRQVELMTGRRPAVETLRAALLRAASSR